MKWKALKWWEESTHDGIYKQAGGEGRLGVCFLSSFSLTC